MTEFEEFQQKYGDQAVFWFIYDGLFHGKKKIKLPRSEFEKYQAENGNPYKEKILDRLSFT
jgi:hypothetical protein